MIEQRQKHLEIHLQISAIETKSGISKLHEALDKSEIGAYGFKKRYNCPQTIRDLSRPKLLKVPHMSPVPDKSELLNRSNNYSNSIRNRSFSRIKPIKRQVNKGETINEDLDKFEKRLEAVKRETSPRDLKVLSYDYKSLNYY